MITDYGAKLGWRFDVNPEEAEMMTVTTSAVLPINDITGGAA
jgi:hypothetical protein